MMKVSGLQALNSKKVSRSVGATNIFGDPGGFGG
jgi:hypothetical protein